MNRNINIGIGSIAERMKAQPLLRLAAPDPNLLPGTNDVATPDSAPAKMVPVTCGMRYCAPEKPFATTVSTATSHATKIQKETQA